MKQPKFRWLSVGAFVAIVVWILASVAFAFYVATFGSYDKTYGSLAGAVIGLLWLWLTNVALLFGAELDSELERGRQLQAGIAAEEELQLPARDTRGIRKARKKEQKDIARGRAIRVQAEEDDDTSPATDDDADWRPRHAAAIAPRRRRQHEEADVAGRVRGGYVLGARAGRERYDQIMGTVDKVRSDPRVQEKTQQAVDAGRQQAPVVADKVTSAAPRRRPRGRVEGDGVARVPRERPAHADVVGPAGPALGRPRRRSPRNRPGGRARPRHWRR